MALGSQQLRVVVIEPVLHVPQAFVEERLCLLVVSSFRTQYSQSNLDVYGVIDITMRPEDDSIPSSGVILPGLARLTGSLRGDRQ